MRAMVVEKEENLRHWLGRLLDRTEGYQCVGYCSSVDKLEAEALRLRPNLLLLDSHSAASLPPDALARLRKSLPGLYVVLMDLEEGPSYEKLAKRAGADGFLSKARVPESLALLRARLKPGTAVPST